MMARTAASTTAPPSLSSCFPPLAVSSGPAASVRPNPSAAPSLVIPADWCACAVVSVRSGPQRGGPLHQTLPPLSSEERQRLLGHGRLGTPTQHRVTAAEPSRPEPRRAWTEDSPTRSVSRPAPCQAADNATLGYLHDNLSSPNEAVMAWRRRDFAEPGAAVNWVLLHEPGRHTLQIRVRFQFIQGVPNRKQNEPINNRYISKSSSG